MKLSQTLAGRAGSTTPGQSATRADLAAALDQYTLGDELGRGATGVVYLARHEPLQRLVAVKQLSPELTADPDFRERFEVEAQVLASLRHPHIMQVFDFVNSGDMSVLVMEVLQGGTVWDLFRLRGVTQRKAVALALAACAATASAHASGVYHRDIKPENLIFDATGVVKVADFGLAYVVNGDTTKATPDGRVYGSPAYMAPEQATGDALGVQTDVYAIGTMLYEMLSGSLPFTGLDSVAAALSARVERDPIDLRGTAPQVPFAISEVTMKAIQRDRRERHPSAEVFGMELAGAAANAWGAEWLTDSGIDVQGSPRIVNAARTLRLQRGVPVVDAAADARMFSEPQEVASSEAEQPVKPSFTERFGGAWSISAADLVELAEVRSALRRPVLWRAASLCALIITTLLLVSGFMATGGVPGEASTDVTANDQPLRAVNVVEADLRDGLRVDGLDDGDGLRLQLSAFGFAFADIAGEADGDSATFDTAGLAWQTSGRVSAEITSVDDAEPVAAFEMRATNPPLFSLAGVVSALLLLFGLNRLDLGLKALAGVMRPSARSLGRLAIAGGFVGVVAAVGTNIGFGNDHTVGSALAVGAGALAASVLGGIAAAFRPSRSDRR